MRKIEQQMIAAIRSGKGWQSGNTQVSVEPAVTRVFLHGNHIATIRNQLERIDFTLAGWPTPTMRSCVNALLREFANGSGRCFAVGQQRGRQIYRTWRSSHDADGFDIEREITATEWVCV